ncbi:MAG: hypothetical protein M0C28_12360 [Candidatus Moduliflexus flocculans]|nr:hypothetical protein [Candidatus Moduliflexus flocculans]
MRSGCWPARRPALGLVHTVIGPDHYLPFIVIGRAREWTLRKTLGVAFLAGLGHILSSIVLGFVGIALGIAVAKLEGVESTRGTVAAWLLIGFGFAYFVWGMRRAWRGKAHTHPHLHDHLHNGVAAPTHEHVPEAGHDHDTPARPPPHSRARLPRPSPRREAQEGQYHALGPVHDLRLRPLRAAHPAGHVSRRPGTARPGSSWSPRPSA